jgi:hypothetical protein
MVVSLLVVVYKIEKKRVMEAANWLLGLYGLERRAFPERRG